MSAVRMRVLSVLAALACAASMLAASAVPASAAGASGGAVGGGQGYSGGGSGSGPVGGKGLSCYPDLSSTVYPYKRAYKGPDPRCEIPTGEWNVTNAYVTCNLGYQVWRFYGTKENPAAYTTMSQINARTRKSASTIDTVCPGAGVSKAAEQQDADSTFWMMSPNPWDARVGSSNKRYTPPQGESVWNVRTGEGRNGCQEYSQGYETVDCNGRFEPVYGSFAFNVAPKTVDDASGSGRRTASPSNSGEEGDTNLKSDCVRPNGRIDVYGKSCPLMSGPLLYDSAENEKDGVPVTIGNQTVRVKSCLDLTASRLTRPGGPYAGEYTSARGMLQGGTSLRTVPWGTWSTDKKTEVQQQARTFVQDSVVSAYAKLTVERATLFNVSVRLTPAYASAILGLSASLNTRLASGAAGVSASKVTPETLLFQGTSVANNAAPCGSALDFALYSMLTGEEKTTADGEVVSAPVSSKARKTARAVSREEQIRTGFCVAPIVQHAWVLNRSKDVPAKWDEVLPNGKDDNVLYHREIRYGKKKATLSTVKLAGQSGTSLVRSVKNDTDMLPFYKEAVAKSMRAVYEKDPDALPLDWWAPTGTVYQSAEGLASPPATSSIEDRIEGATNAMNCVTSYFDNGVLVVDPARTPPPETDCVPGVGPECTPTEVEEVTEIVGSPTPVRVDLAIDRGLSARGTFETYTARVANVSLWCGTRLCNHAANPLDPTLVSATGRLTLDVAGEKADEFRQCQTINQGNCDYFIKSQPSGESLRGQTLQVVFFSPTPEGVVVRPVLESTAASEQTYKRKYKTITTCVPVPAPKPSPAPSGVKAPAPRPGTAATPAPSASQSCTSRTVEDGYQPDKVVSVAVSFSTPGGGNRVVSGAIGGT